MRIKYDIERIKAVIDDICSITGISIAVSDTFIDWSRRCSKPCWHTEKILIRAHDSVQVGTTESIRRIQAKKAYQINPKAVINQDTTYLLLDDVWTTGASMKAAHKILTRAGAKKIIILVLALSHIKH